MTTTILYHITAAAAFAFAAIYFVHMFQLNGYHRDGHMRWHNDILGAISAKMTFAFVAFVLMIFANDITKPIASVLNVLTVVMFLPGPAKKPLVYTARIKRLLAAIIILYSALVVITSLVPYCHFVSALGLVLVNFVVLLSDIINSPVEKAIKNGFIKDAKKILERRKNLTIIGITGSYGKTSCKYFLTKLLSAKYNVLMTPASYNTPMGVVKTVREHLKNSHEIFICEMGAKNIGDIKELCDIVHPHIGLISSIGPQHLESFKTIENVVNTKFELYDTISDGGKVYLNYDNELIRSAKSGKDIVSFGCEYENASCLASNITLSEKGTDFDVTYNGVTTHFSTKLLGTHNVQNLAGCIAIAVDMGVELSDLILAVKRLESVPHRLQMIDGGNFTIIDDAFNANPSGTKAALEVLGSFDGTKIIVTPGMIELGEKQAELNREFGINCTKVCDYIFLVGGRIADDVYEGANSTCFDKEKLLRFDKVEEAVEYARMLQSDKKKFVLLENDLPDNY
ncbi:MAG: UDP-N-acetylmuramoyl-tripeptide--D-alanyl-D-alanine ligase [Clostridia bacterium]|nr:UDP-N-acetylmuramoyl-tripeptide--D-alanyl-D-alanine ligase [Clostridia bacterium]